MSYLCWFNCGFMLVLLVYDYFGVCVKLMLELVLDLWVLTGLCCVDARVCVVWLLTGLWLADLSVSQLLLEKVQPGQRGTVNGVQSSLNTFMDMFKYILVIAIPAPNQFGLLILISFLFICLGGVSFTIYARRHGTQHHGMQHHKLKAQNSDQVAPESVT